MRWGPADLETLSTENRSSSESGYGTSVGDTRADTVEDNRGDTRHQDTELDEVFYLEEEEEEVEERFPFNVDKSHISVGLSSGLVQYKHS